MRCLAPVKCGYPASSPGGLLAGSHATEKVVIDQVLGHRPGVLAVDANPVAQTATVTFDPARTSIEELRRWVDECGKHCAGQSVPGHICDPMAEGAATHEGMAHDHAAMQRADDAHGHGRGGHAGMSMEAMERDMRNRFLVAFVFTIPIVAWSMVGTKLLGTELATPFGLDHDVWQLLLSLPVVLYASSIFFTGAVAALRAKTLDMMVLVAVAIGTGWLYSVAATFFIEGEVCYEAAGMLARFVLLGHWFEMRARCRHGSEHPRPRPRSEAGPRSRARDSTLRAPRSARRNPGSTSRHCRRG